MLGFRPLGSQAFGGTLGGESVDKWSRPFSEPVRNRVAAASVVLIASGMVAISPVALTQPETVTESRWHQPLSLPPIMAPQRLATGDQQVLALVEAVPFAETVSYDRWQRSLSLPPVMARPRLATGDQQFLALVEAGPFAESVTYDRWHRPLSEPVRIWPRTQTSRLQGIAYLPGMTAPVVFAHSWYSPFSEPVRSRPGLAVYEQRALGFLQKIDSIPIEQFVQRAELDDYVVLFDLDATAIGGDIYRFTSSAFAAAPIVWNGNTYGPTPVEVSGFEYNGRGPLPTPTIRVANVSLAFGAAAIAFDDLLGATLTRTRTFRRYLDGQPEADPTRHFPLDIYRVDRKSLQNKSTIEWQLAAVIDQEGVYLPRRPILRNACTHRYRKWNGTSFDYTNATCPFAGATYFKVNGAATSDPAQDKCGKRLSDCKKRFGRAPLPTRAFPGVARA